MRLICPNCDAQYEVDASLIPETGRDVQCSDCGHVWFQAPDMDIDQPGDDDMTAVVWPDLATQVAEPAPAAPPEDDAEPDPQVLRRHTLDESLLAVLREEAERETRARAEETARAAGRGLEMQPELGLTDAEPAPRLRIRPRATTQPAPDDEPAPNDQLAPPVAEPGPSLRAARRELLPDIDRINSTLDASNATRSGAAAVQVPEPPERRRRGFRRGFLLVLVVGALLFGVYAESDRISAALPQVAPMIDGFVGLVDAARLGLDGLVKGLLVTLNRHGA